MSTTLMPRPRVRLTPIRERENEWRLSAACKGLTHLFFPVEVEGPNAIIAEATAKEICSECPVRLSCLEWALKAREPDGIWGGMDERERRRVMRQRRRSALS